MYFSALFEYVTAFYKSNTYIKGILSPGVDCRPPDFSDEGSAKRQGMYPPAEKRVYVAVRRQGGVLKIRSPRFWRGDFFQENLYGKLAFARRIAYR